MGALFLSLLIVGPVFATVQQQRARLPPAAECSDPVEGTWKSHAFNEMYQEWNIFTLEIRRDPANRNLLKGTVTNHAWYGPETEETRGPCSGRLQYLVSMDGEGSVDDEGHIRFGGVGTWRLDEVYCGDFWGGYNLDQFAGTIDLEALEFQSVNNDGGRFVNVPTVFRRIGCAEGEGVPDEGPRIAVSPPSFYPPEEESQGCALRL